MGDGNTDLEDQHNSATLGALRGGVSEVGAAGQQVDVVLILVDADQRRERGRSGEMSQCGRRAACCRRRHD